MSKMSKCQNLKNRIKSERSNIFEIGHMRKVAQFLRNMRNIISKNMLFFYYPLLLQCMEKLWVNFSKNKGMGMEFNIKNFISMAANIILSIYEVKFHSHTFIFGKVYPDFFHAL